MVIVSDTSAITNLIQLERLDLLHDLFGEVFLAISVQQELYQLPNQKIIMKSCKWIKVEAVQNQSLLQKLVLQMKFRIHPKLFEEILKQVDEL
ncbi:MAG: hypothetical protein SFU99_05245 [Saprospiraceae bacterium]|nr:hypothetical protein [Saprospiraceae bacterium]